MILISSLWMATFVVGFCLATAEQQASPARATDLWAHLDVQLQRKAVRKAAGQKTFAVILPERPVVVGTDASSIWVPRSSVERMQDCSSPVATIPIHHNLVFEALMIFVRLGLIQFDAS